MNRRQTGVALISVLLVMSLALLILGAVLHSHRLLVKSSAQQLQQLHLRQLATAGEAWALRLLQDSPRGANPTLDLSQEWARAVPGFDTNQAQVQIEIHDLAGRLNLNRLLAGGRVDQVTLERWTRLLALLDLPPLPRPWPASARPTLGRRPRPSPATRFWRGLRSMAMAWAWTAAGCVSRFR